ncbi:protein kinase [Paenibacillus sp. MSJ-34]|uniref:protein kinase domain-containing protein n=1 Tax=Paenibacillus sp. MSJ-34 TaxID=2841529 RepID=UPI001C10EAFA|nr:protein kinase [Paenibacillus sp. MSJ-34]MBU5442506.1 LuxR C-terminal-related transcriptional regulator [Paenibacillus sp. MSJ-34]
MINVPGYRIDEVILDDAHFVVCYAHSDLDSRRVLLKIVKDGHRTMLENAKLLHEQQMLTQLNMPHVIRPLSLISQGHCLILVSEWIGGVTLRTYYRTQRVSIPAFLSLAIRTARVLELLHEQGVVHMNIRPDTIVVEPASQRIYLTGFGHALRTAGGGERDASMPLMEGSPPYMAPERTGRTERTIDGRTDLYSIGITFYEMLAGRLPFQAREPLEWAHAHLAQSPLPLRSDQIDVPPFLADLIMKLLAKTPAERYQSARGLAADLERGLRHWERTGSYPRFEPGEHDRPFTVDEHSPASAAEPEIAAMSMAEVLSADVSADQAPSQPGYSQILDLAAVFKASQTFSQENDLDRLIQSLLHILIENAGAQRGCLVTCAGRGLAVEAVAESERTPQTGREMPLPLAEYEGLCQAFIARVIDTSEALYLHDAARQGPFVGDPYMIRRRPKSVLGLPLFVRGERAGALYLENNVTPGAFAPDRLGVVRMLAAQLIYVATLKYAAGQPLAPFRTPSLLSAGVSLTEREREVLQLLADGLSNQEIADGLFVTVDTIKVHVKHIYAKLKVKRRIQAVTKAREIGLL